MMKEAFFCDCAAHQDANVLMRKQLLSASEHDILLGILKKVEAKNGVMATIWALFFGSISAAVFAVSSIGAPVEQRAFAQTGALFIVTGVPFIIASIMGTRQLDNFSKLRWPRFRKTSSRARNLQALLLEDAILKEDLLWISQRGAVIFALSVPTLATLFLWLIQTN